MNSMQRFALRFWYSIIALFIVLLIIAPVSTVVGVIVSLALFFGQHVFWPQGMGGHFDVAAAVIAAAAALALIRFKRPVVQVIAACALAGWALSLLQ